MLPPHVQELLTAYVDGELSSRQRKAVQRLLQRSSRARKLYAQLKSDSRLLISLPRRKLEQDLSGSVVDVIRSQGLDRPRPVVPARSLSRVTAWAGMVAAAVLFLMVGTLSYVYFAAGYRDNSTGQPVARKGPAHSPTAVPVVVKLPDAVTPQNHGEPVQEPGAWPEAPEMPPPLRFAQETSPYPAYSEASALEDLNPTVIRPQDPVAAPSTLTPAVGSSLEELKLSRPIFLAMHELDQQSQFSKLQEDLRTSNGFRLEMFCRDSARALDLLQSAFKDQGIVLRLDGEVQHRLKQRAKTNFALFVENVTPEELARVLQKLSKDDQAALASDPKAGQFADKSFLKPLIGSDRTQLAALLGVPPTRIQPGKAGSGKHAERSALVLTYVATPGVRIASREVRLFLDGRKEARPGTVQLFLVLQNQNF